MIYLGDNILYEIFCETIKKAATEIAADGMELLEKAYRVETYPQAKDLLGAMIENAKLAAERGKSICQSPGFPVVYVTLGKDFALDVNPRDVSSRALSQITRQGYLRPSIVHPITRKNTGDNTGENVPNIEVEVEPNLKFTEIVVSLKGCGSELFNAVKVFTPAEIGPGGEGLIEFICKSVVEAGGGPCPPGVIGVGIGGQMDMAARLSRRAVSMRRWNDTHKNPEIAKLENKLLSNINSLKIGPGGLGGDATALAVKVEWAYTHTAILPVVVNFHCWPARRARCRVYDDRKWETFNW